MENTYNLLKSFFSFWLCALCALSLIDLHADETEPQAYLIYPKNGDVVSSPFKVIFGLKNFGVVPAGIDLQFAGHHHLLINSPGIDYSKPIPADKFHIAASTALAGEQLGLKFTYLDAGSGALHPVSMKMISSVRKEISCPIIVGGGIKSYEQLENAWLSGADIVVVGNAIEKNSALINQLDSRIKCN